MKKHLLVLFSVLFASITFANGDFEKAMSKAVPDMFSSSNSESLQAAINQLDRIAAAEGDRWEPYYYQAFGYIRMTGMVEKAADKDSFLDLALKTIEEAEAIQPNDSELEAMRGYVHMIRITVDAASRGMMYSGMAFTSFQKALALNPENPRAHFLLGQMQYGTAQFMGGGDGGACASFFKSLVLFGQQSDTGNPFAPSWGKDGAEKAIKEKCEKGG